MGYKNYADDVVEEFVRLSIKNGIDIIRIFDALNDLRNIETAVERLKIRRTCTRHCCIYDSPVHNIDLYVELAKKSTGYGVRFPCIKDMSGILAPYYGYELIKELKKNIDIPIQLHTHFTSGMTDMTYLKASGGVIIDTAMSPFGMGTSQPQQNRLWQYLKGTEYDTGLDLDLLCEIAEYFRKVKDKYFANGILSPNVFNIDTNVLSYQIPGGMLSNLMSQLEQANAMDKYKDVLKEVPRVREDLGYPPLVTPSSQFVGTQAVFNVLSGSRYKMIPNEIKDYVSGRYGRPSVPISEEIKKKIIGDEEVITCRPADLIEPQLEMMKAEIKEYYEQEEDVLSYAVSRR